MTIIFNKKIKFPQKYYVDDMAAMFEEDGFSIKAETTLSCLLTNPISQESLKGTQA
jgi:hypothetical protein